MSLIAIPNISEGARTAVIEACRDAAETSGARVLDVHSDGVHNRSVFTIAGTATQLTEGLASLAIETARAIDLTEQRGVHPRLGGLDVAPIVPHNGSMSEAVTVARDAGRLIGLHAELPVYLYGEASERAGTAALPTLRRGGLPGLIERFHEGLVPDFGPREITPERGVVCVGARDVLIAFNVWVEGELGDLSGVAKRVRVEGVVRALGLRIDKTRGQISMNLVDPKVMGIDDAFERVERSADRSGLRIVGTELVGLVPERFLPDPDAKAARSLIAPGRSLESML